MMTVVLTLIIAIHINRDLLMDTLIGQGRMPIYGQCGENYPPPGYYGYQPQAV